MQAAAQPMATPSTECIFLCGRPADSKEHLWARGLWDLIPGAHGTLTMVAGSGGDRVAEESRTIQKLGVTVRCVCRTCNSEWMSQLEEHVKPILATMIGGSSARLTWNDQMLLTSWVTLKLLVSEYLPNSYRAVPPWVYGWYAASRLPPVNTAISIAQAHGAGPVVDARRASLAPGSRDGSIWDPSAVREYAGVWWTYKVANVVFQIRIMFDDDEWHVARPIVGSVSADAFDVPICPATDGVTWPPARSLPDWDSYLAYTEAGGPTHVPQRPAHRFD